VHVPSLPDRARAKGLGLRRRVGILVVGAVAACAVVAFLSRSDADPSASEVVGWARASQGRSIGHRVPFEESYVDPVRASIATGYVQLGAGGTFRLAYETPVRHVVCGNGERILHERPEHARYYYTDGWLPGFDLMTGGPEACRYQLDPPRPGDGESVCLRCAPAVPVWGNVRICVSSALPTRGALTSLQYLSRSGEETLFRFGRPRRPDVAFPEEELCPDPSGRPDRAGWVDITRGESP
jgi:hypothetical protein